MPDRYWPLETGRIVTSPFGPRPGEFHTGVDFGFPGGSAGRKVYAIQSGTVLYCGSADGYGGPDPAGWIVIDSDDSEGGGCLEYGHIVRQPWIKVGAKVQAGQQIAVINPDSNTNGGTAPHLHVSDMPRAYDPETKQDLMPRLVGASEPPAALKKEADMGWTGDPTWLADVLKAYDGPKLRVRELPGWKDSGHGDMKSLWGIVLHHTGNASEPAESIRRGRPDLPGPLSQLHIAPDGTVTVVAAGVCWHAGAGEYPGLPTDMANWHCIGIECAWPRDTSLTPATEPWPNEQYVAARDTVAAILLKLGVDSSRVIGHKEWAGKRQGKWDPTLDMAKFRGDVNRAMRGDFKTARPITPAPAPAPAPAPTPAPPPFLYPSDADMLRQIWEQLLGVKGRGWPQLGGKTLVDAVAELMKK